ncbi:hypothetical protein K435DRAFT_841047 [Dendrothele bispora CBS 962.96]|uniref:Uncharacterized protein n=1 Tax=Dendrothele bispora (strain CBS 962.96) TaxID=1314807 RepID=A0A4V4HEK0_DENBC|nr:hypothetical protein K435DRAFT_841047 [Dendrothele bispora CBS 962.96]
MRCGALRKLFRRKNPQSPRLSSDFHSPTPVFLQRLHSLLSSTMSAEAGNRSRSATLSGDEDSTQFKAKVSIHLVAYERVPAGKKNKEQRVTKTKEIEHVFEPTVAGYIGLMKKMLARHDVTILKVSEKTVFPFKVQVPPDTKHSSTDVDNYQDYTDIVSKILHKQPSKAITVYIDMKHIKKKVTDEDISDDEDEIGAVAEKRNLLEKMYGNPNDNSCSYKCVVTGDLVPLTPIMMAEWARAMYLLEPVKVDNKATVQTPPNTLMFDPATRRSSLRSSKRRSSSLMSSDASSSRTSDIGHISNIISLLAGPRREPETPASAPAAPTLLEHQNTPSKLPRFLSYAKDRLGIINAPAYERSLRDQSYGPDILHLVEDKDLISLNIPSGDVIRMKKAAPIWMASDDSKHKPVDDPVASDDSKHKPVDDPETHPPKQPLVTFEKRWIDPETGRDTGAARVYGTLEHIDGWEDQQAEPGLSWFYKCEVLQQFLPVPAGYKAIIVDDNSDF